MSGFYMHWLFTMSSSSEKVSPKILPVWLVLDLYSCCVGHFGSIGKVYHFGFLSGKKVKKTALLWSHDLHMA